MAKELVNRGRHERGILAKRRQRRGNAPVGCGRVKLDLHGVAAQLALQLVGRALRYDLALIDDRQLQIGRAHV